MTDHAYKKVLVDASNVDQLLPEILAAIGRTPFVGLDCETHDDNRHDGLNAYCGYDPVTRTKPENKPLVFDIRRTVMTGFSLYPQGHDTAYYINLAQADVPNRVPFEKVRSIFQALPVGGFWIAHNATFEVTMFMMCCGVRLENIICTLQMAVSAYGPDEYDPAHLRALGNPFMPLVPDILKASASYGAGQEMSEDLSDLFFKIVAKESEASYSYNGVVDSVTFGYGLKTAVKSWFSHEMTTFKDVLRGKAHMGQLTGQEVVDYGCEDAYWAVRLFERLLLRMKETGGDDLINVFFAQENPMIQVFADIWMGGLKVNDKAIYAAREEERSNYANVLRRMRKAIQSLLPFGEPHARMLEIESWYAKGFQKYRTSIESWAKLADHPDDFTEALRARGPVSNAWAKDNGKPESKGPNFSHYMPMRVLMYDLLGEKLIMSEGKVQSDGNARGRLKTRLEKRLKEQDDPRTRALVEILDCLAEIAGIEQRMKLYLTPYTMLMDPETAMLYPVVSCMLATRRMAARFPNPMQLAKRGASTYVRGFFEGDNPDHLVVSIDWSAVELVEIGEFSGDPEFIKAFGQIPHEDLHSGAAADILSVDVPGLTETIFKSMKRVGTVDEFIDLYGDELDNTKRLFTNLKGEPMDPAKALKYWRTEVGKGANFNYWYSGFLGTVGERMGWSTETTGRATERYRERFHVAESWRLDLIEEVKLNGYVTLPDGHRRVRFEATEDWRQLFSDMWVMPGYGHNILGGYYAFAHQVASKIQKRAFNQTVNSYIQGSCATIAKRSILRIMKACRERGWDHRLVRFMMPIHDELVFSVHWSIAPAFITLARSIMIDHPDLFQHCKLDASPSIGRTFAPFDKKNPYGQIELYEAPELSCIPSNKIGQRLSEDEMAGVVEYLRMAA